MPYLVTNRFVRDSVCVSNWSTSSIHPGSSEAESESRA